MTQLNFKTPEECSAYGQLLSEIPRYQTWEEVGIVSHVSLRCHVCGKDSLTIKRGRAQVNAFFESECLDAYTYWQLCVACKNEGWTVPRWCFRKKIEYQNIKVNTKIEIEGCPIFKYPQVVGLNTKSLLIS